MPWVCPVWAEGSTPAPGPAECTPPSFPGTWSLGPRSHPSGANEAPSAPVTAYRLARSARRKWPLRLFVGVGGLAGSIRKWNGAV